MISELNFKGKVTILCKLKKNDMEYKEYLNQIIRFNGDKDLLLMREKYNDPSTLKWHEYKELIACSAVSTILEPIWCLEGTYYDYQPEENAHQVRFHDANEE